MKRGTPVDLRSPDSPHPPRASKRRRDAVRACHWLPVVVTTKGFQLLL